MSAPLLPDLAYAGDLGTGGYADVYAYQARFPRRLVAVKVLRAADDATAAQLAAEANALAALEHPHIVAIYGAGRTPERRPYLVTQWCPGPTLHARLKAAPLAASEACAVGVRLAGAVATAHAAGLLHRDIKPANVLTSRYGEPILADFGAAGGAQAPELGLSIPWAAPEVLAGGPHGERSDVYSLAATLFTAVVGRPPHAGPGASASEVVRSTLGGDAVIPASVPDALAAVLRAGLARRLDDRPASATALGRALQQACAVLGGEVPRLLLPAAAPATGGEPSGPVTSSTLLEAPCG